MATLTRHYGLSCCYYFYALLLLVSWNHKKYAWSLTQQHHHVTRSVTRQRPKSSSGFGQNQQQQRHQQMTLFAETSIASAVEDSPLTEKRYRRVDAVEKYARLPVWPAWNGVLIFIVSRLLGNEAAAKLEDTITGRVCPNFFENTATSPFIMLVHHCHSFAPWDALRWFQQTFFPEGFPAHPHRGFVTLTYILEGGFVHRDSEGIRQEYGSENTGLQHHSQWLFTGSGLLHEEMFLQKQDWFKPTRQELYQLWINVPAAKKMNEPFTELVGPSEAPVVLDRSSHEEVLSETLVLAGSYKNEACTVSVDSPLAVFHVKLSAGAVWTYDLDELLQQEQQQGSDTAESTGTRRHHTNVDAANVILYVRKGGRLVSACGTEIPVHHTAFFSSGKGSSSEVQVKAPSEASDFLVLAGLPLGEPVTASGSMVMTSAAEINQAYADYQAGLFGKPWDHQLSDEEWKVHVQESRWPQR